MSLTSPHNPPVDYIIKGNALQKNTSSRNLRLGMQQCALFWPQHFLWSALGCNTLWKESDMGQWVRICWILPPVRLVFLPLLLSVSRCYSGEWISMFLPIFLAGGRGHCLFPLHFHFFGQGESFSYDKINLHNLSLKVQAQIKIFPHSTPPQDFFSAPSWVVWPFWGFLLKKSTLQLKTKWKNTTEVFLGRQ